MSAPESPLQASRRKTLHLGIACTLLLIASLLWALRTPSPSPVTAAQSPRPTTAPMPAPAPLSLAAFSAPLWTSPAPAAEPPAPALQPAAPPLKLQLLAIHTDSSPAGIPHLRASLFDPDTARVHSVVRGDTISGREVIAIEPSRITLGPPAAPVSLLLRPGEPAR